MFRIFVYTFIIGLLSASSMHSQNLAEGQASARNYNQLDGIYEFVSESTVLTKPKKAAYKRESPEWTGIWNFQKGYYTRMLMKRSRDSFFSPKKLDDLGFESFAGSYTIERESVWLLQTYALNPLNVNRSALMYYRIDGDTLTLVENLHPYTEDLREGARTIVLRRVR